ncbi:MAG: MotA/TolQ/ExbB proton channel family protein [Gammaproteobacteria bacterium]|nr:MotA/TolQ/ExbB proton channel family protein [Gammaproteobacteria bacterium]MCF6260069.1 MotA/TolQ/ExbB proton channel family protein [Gammaproteobacteria bacterium]
MNIVDLFQQGGPVMLVLLAMSVLAVTIILLKLFQFYRSGLRRLAFVDDTVLAVQRGEHEQAIKRLQQHDNPVAKVLESAIRYGADPTMSTGDVEAEVSRVGSAQIRNLESWLRGLSSIAHLSPLLGLLGTVTGMIVAFMSLEAAGSRVDPSILSGGIWEALLTTAFGLTVAIPAMAAFYYLEGEVDRVRAAMKDASIRVLRHFGKTPHVGSHDDERIEDETHGI